MSNTQQDIKKTSEQLSLKIAAFENAGDYDRAILSTEIKNLTNKLASLKNANKGTKELKAVTVIDAPIIADHAEGQSEAIRQQVINGREIYSARI